MDNQARTNTVSVKDYNTTQNNTDNLLNCFNKFGKNSNFVDSFIETISDAEKANNDNNKNLATKDWFAKTKTLYKASIENKNIKNIAFIGKKAWNTTELVNYLNKTNHRDYKIGKE